MDEPDFGLVGTYQVLGRILKLKVMQELILVLLTCKVSIKKKIMLSFFVIYCRLESSR